ncbi:PPM-type phosphatase-like domain containing protein [Babesia gibsoni]|uniref:PPM-type phosphatase-like domain containing protein n=1 Tax=Babesia gibsoni TaxID=33632 RepID=A0AAD8PF76_BABGI|nr:PPM-type phosphatase-like domain containing protein [Babesia gibsoni]
MEDDTYDESTIDVVIPSEGKWFSSDEDAGAGWYTHEEQHWMYNKNEGIYFHIDSQMVVSAGDEVPKNLVEDVDEGECSDNGSGADEDVDAGQSGMEEDMDAQTSDEEDELGIDFEKDLRAATVSRAGNTENKEQCEDYYVTRECVSIHLVSESGALCYYSGVFDGHCGYKCAEYLMKHLKNNILSVYRQAVRNIGSKKQGKQYFPVESLEVRALMQGCTKGFEMTDNNFCNIAKQFNLLDGSTATISLIYGPDDDGNLKLITSHVGDSRAILCSMPDNEGCFAQAMTCDHKPNNVKERQYIEKNGGVVEFMQGAWRCMARARNGQISGCLATSRALGDYPLKHPNRVVSSEPDVSVYTINLESDIFLVLVTDGITAVLSNQQIIEIVCEAIDEECTPEAAAERVVITAEQRGSYDDKTCTVIYFGWHRDLFDKCVRDKEEDAIREAAKISDNEEQRDSVDKEDDMFMA